MKNNIFVKALKVNIKFIDFLQMTEILCFFIKQKSRKNIFSTISDSFCYKSLEQDVTKNG